MHSVPLKKEWQLVSNSWKTPIFSLKIEGRSTEALPQEEELKTKTERLNELMPAQP
jgi:hypothetical protein